VPRAVKFVLNFTQAGVVNPVINSFHWGYALGDISAADLLTVTNEVASRWAPDMGPLFTTALRLNEVIGTSLSSPTSPVAIATPGTTGAVSSAPVPAAVSVIEQRHVSRRYRGGHSRIYWAGAPAAELLAANEWQPAYITALHAAETAWTGDIATSWPGAYGSVGPINISYYHGFTPFTYPSGRVRNIPTLRTVPLVDQVATWAFNPKCGSQRRRNGQSA
jgi:hypothetical protein